jgi:hypothetical protein
MLRKLTENFLLLTTYFLKKSYELGWRKKFYNSCIFRRDINFVIEPFFFWNRVDTQIIDIRQFYLSTPK